MMKKVDLKTAITEIMKSLEYNTAKEESFVNDLLKKHKTQRKASLEKIVESIHSKVEKKEIIFEDFFSDILNYFRPFSLMMEEIYKFLNYYAATIESRASQFRFNFEKLRQRITFDISNFPRELIRNVGHQEISQFFKIFEINLPSKGDYNGDQREEVAIDFISLYDGDFYNRFLTPVSYFWSIKDNIEPNIIVQFKDLEKQIAGVFKNIRILLNLLFEQLQVIPKQTEMVFFGKLQGNPPEVVFEEKRILLKNGFEFDELRVKGKLKKEINSGLIYKLNCLALALQFWDNQYKRVDFDRNHWSFKREAKLESIAHPEAYIDLIKQEIAKYEKALNDILVFKEFKERKILLENIFQFVRLPFWKHRWHIYELWALIFCLNIAKNTCKVKLNLKDHVDYLELTIPKAVAKEPVASIHSNQVDIDCWFQRKTINPITGKGIEPDLRFMTKGAYPIDIFVLENKDRRNCSGSHVNDVKKTYLSGTCARNIWIVNYENYLGKKYSNKLYKETVEKRNVWVAPNFKPTKVTPEFYRSFYSMLNGYLYPLPEITILTYDLIIDKSGSMSSKPILATVETIFGNLSCDPDGMYIFDTRLTRLDFNEMTKIRNFISDQLECDGGTELVSCFRKYLESKDEFPKIIYVITDGDSVDECYKKYQLEMLNKGSSLVFVTI